MSATDIKPCPFCGGKPYEGGTGDDRYVIKCYECGVVMTQDRKDKVIEEWNKRSAPVIECKGNWKKVKGPVYYVTNQNGFNGALYDYFEAGKENSHSKEEVRRMMQNYPVLYPCFIVIKDLSFECARVYIEVFNSENL